MARFIFKRLIQVVVLTFIFVSITFVILQAMPGDIADIYLDPNIPSEVRDSIREKFGIDLPLHIQYARYMGNFIRGDLGYSFRHYPRTVWSIIWERLPRTFLLFFTATISYYYMGYTLGKFIAWKRGARVEYAATFGGVFLYTLFLPVYALLLMWFFGLHLRWFPLGQFLSPRVWKDVLVSSGLIFNYIILSAAGFFGAVLLALVISKSFKLGIKAGRTLLFGFAGAGPDVCADACGRPSACRRPRRRSTGERAGCAVRRGRRRSFLRSLWAAAVQSSAVAGNLFRSAPLFAAPHRARHRHRQLIMMPARTRR